MMMVGATGDEIVVGRPMVDWTDQAPDNKEKIELARIKVKVGKRVTNEITTLAISNMRGNSRLAVANVFPYLAKGAGDARIF
jgi:hypothetical protein